MGFDRAIDRRKVRNTIEAFEAEALRTIDTGEYGWSDDYHEQMIHSIGFANLPLSRRLYPGQSEQCAFTAREQWTLWTNMSPCLNVLRSLLRVQRLCGAIRVDDADQSVSSAREGKLAAASRKSLDYALRLFGSAYGHRYAASVTPKELRVFAEFVAQLSPSVAKSPRNSDIGLSELLGYSQHSGGKISAGTQKRLLGEVKRFWNWCVDEGHVVLSPVPKSLGPKTVSPKSYAVLFDDEAVSILAVADPLLAQMMRWCMLSGMRAGECLGLTADDIEDRGNDGWWIHIRPNAVRKLKSAASERKVPLHSLLVPDLDNLPKEGRLFPSLTVPKLTKLFRKASDAAEVTREGVVFHSTRKWFVTKCEQNGVPENFTAAIVGHGSGRSANQVTYGLYSGGITDAQKREIVEGVKWVS